jgi:ferrochelatase
MFTTAVHSAGSRHDRCDGSKIHGASAATRQAYGDALAHGIPRILFSAHGLPEKIIKAGDPYAAQCAMTVEALRKTVAIDGLDSVLCFQSRVGPLKWIGPSTDDEVRRAGHDKVPLVVVPIAFVSDHSETLVEINIEYRHLASEHGVPFFAFVPTVGADQIFIDGLAAMVRERLLRREKCTSHTGAVLCPPDFTACPCRSLKF